MRDLFDDFLEELRRREAVARGEDPDAGRPPRGSKDPSDPGADDGDDGDDDDAEEPAGERPADDQEAGHDHESPDHEDDDDDRPQPIDSRRRRGGPPRRRGPGGPNDGADDRGGRAARAGRRFGIGLLIVAIIAVVVLFGVGLDLWTDALWFKSVGFDSVFWTRLGATFGLFLGAFVVALVVLFGNLWLARRLAPAAPGGGGSFRSLFDRLNEAAQNADVRRGGPRSMYGGRESLGNGPTLAFETGDLPDLTPVAGWILGALALFIALIVAASVSSAWETVLLWIHRVPFAPPGATAVTDPIFNRDVSFFLFELPFLRLAQSLFNGLVVASLIIALASYFVTASRGGLVFSTPIRVHLAVLGGLFLLSVAFGYQLDKFELSYSTRGVAEGVSFTDQNAQFFAYDVLTVLSGLAAALLVGGAFTRMLWPLGLTLAVWFIASIAVGRLYPEAIQRFTVTPNQYAQESRYIGNNIAMTRLAFDVGGWTDQSFDGTAVLTPEQVAKESETFASARLWDPRPLQTSLDQLQTVRKYYDFTGVDTDRYPIGGDPASGDAVRPRARPRAEPERDRLGEPACHLHPWHRRGDGPGQRGGQPGPAGSARREPAAGLGQWCSGHLATADLLR